MGKITSKELRNKWIKFYESKGHKNIGSVSLIGDGETGVMFNVAGMQSLMPYLLGEKEHKDGKRLCNVQGCVRTIDIDNIGDETHFSFFEMMGNWSIGDYFKKEKVAWTFELLTEVFGLDKNKICSTVFAGSKSAPKDEETAKLLEEIGIKKENIFFLEENWWNLEGTVGTPCGPDNEWFYPKHDNKCCENCDINCSCERYVEIGNDVFMQYKQLGNGKYEELKNKNVDTGFGFERNLAFLNGVTDCYKTDLFEKAIKTIETETGAVYGQNEKTTRAIRIICDHTRTAVMLIGDEKGIVPSNIGAGYILRRLIRRALRYAKQLGANASLLENVSKVYIEEVYNEAYPNLLKKEEYILAELQKEANKFEKTLEQGIKEFEKLIKNLKNFAPDVKIIAGNKAFRLFDTFGFPLELTVELAGENGFEVDEDGFKKAFEEHQAKSKAVQKGDFKSGLADTNEMATKYHTATHLLNAALKKLLGQKCHQAGSNITAERLRFDFPCDHKLTQEELNFLTKTINGWINDGIDVLVEEMAKEKAVEIGAEHQFIDRYPDIVSVYTIGNVSKEICTGPHVKNTKELGKFVIKKEEASSSGIRRIKAILE